VQGLERSWFFFSGYGAYSMPTNLTDNVTILDIQHAKPKGLGLSVPESVVTTDVWYLGLAAFSMFYSLYFALHAILDYFGACLPICSKGFYSSVLLAARLAKFPF
jgi:hypothetical protein